MKKILLLLVLILCCGCKPVVRENANTLAVFNQKVEEQGDHGYYPITIENINSKAELETNVYYKAPQRVVSVWQNSAETVMALGEGENIIAALGIPHEKCLAAAYRPIYEKIPYTSMNNLDVETILMLQPDIIIGWHSTFSAKVLRGTDFWHQRGIHTYIAPSSAPGKIDKTLENEYNDILNLGKIFNKQEEAEKIVAQMKNEINFVTEQTKNVASPTRGLILELNSRNVRVYNAKTLAGNIFQALNGELLAPEATSLSTEQLIELDPDVIFLVIIESNYGKDQLFLDRIYNNPALNHLRCVQNKRVYTIPLYALYTSGTRTYDGIKIMARGLYPELYKE